MVLGNPPNIHCPSGFERVRQHAVYVFLVWLIHRADHHVGTTSKISMQQTWVTDHCLPSGGFMDTGWHSSVCCLSESTLSIKYRVFWSKPSDELRIFTSVFIFGLIWHQKEVSTSLAPPEGLVPPFTHSSGNWLSECHLVLNDHVITFVNVILQGIILIIAHNPFQLHSEK